MGMQRSDGYGWERVRPRLLQVIVVQCDGIKRRLPEDGADANLLRVEREHLEVKLERERILFEGARACAIQPGDC